MSLFTIITVPLEGTISEQCIHPERSCPSPTGYATFLPFPTVSSRALHFFFPCSRAFFFLLDFLILILPRGYWVCHLPPFSHCILQSSSFFFFLVVGHFFFFWIFSFSFFREVTGYATFLPFPTASSRALHFFFPCSRAFFFFWIFSFSFFQEENLRGI